MPGRNPSAAMVREAQQAEKQQVAQVQQGAEQREPEQWLAKQRPLMCSRPTQAEKHSAGHLPVELGPSSSRRPSHSERRIALWCTTSHH